MKALLLSLVLVLAPRTAIALQECIWHHCPTVDDLMMVSKRCKTYKKYLTPRQMAREFFPNSGAVAYSCEPIEHKEKVKKQGGKVKAKRVPRPHRRRGNK